MHTQHDTAELIVTAGGDYVFTVKPNQPRLYAACKNLPWAKIHSHSTLSTGHRRRARRTIKVLTAPASITYAHATQIAPIRRTLTRAGRTSVEIVYIITSADHRVAPPATLASWVQCHWGIENSLHWPVDRTSCVSCVGAARRRGLFIGTGACPAEETRGVRDGIERWQGGRVGRGPGGLGRADD